MKLAIALVVLSLGVMFAVVYQAVFQEMALRTLKLRVVDNSMEANAKEEAITEAKTNINNLKTSLAEVTTKIGELKKKKEENGKLVQEREANLQTCKTEKENSIKKKAEIQESMNKAKADFEAAKAKAQEDIKALKQQVLDRDKAICAFADLSNEEARKLCGQPEAAQ